MTIVNPITKASPTVVPVMQYPDCSAPMDRVHMDLTGPLPTSEEGNKYILVIKDFKTKFVWLYAIKDKTAETIGNIIEKDLIPTFGAMKQLITDRGTEFKNSLMKEICKRFEIKKDTYHTQQSQIQWLCRETQ